MHSCRRTPLEPGATGAAVADRQHAASLADSMFTGAHQSSYARTHAHGYDRACANASDPSSHPAEQTNAPYELQHDSDPLHEGQHVVAESNRRRLQRLLTSRSQALNRSPQDLWSEMRPSAGVLAISNLSDGLRRLGLHVAEDDFAALVQLLADRPSWGAPQAPVITWASWQRFFSVNTPPWEDSAVERRRRLTLQRLLQSLRHTVERDGSTLVKWFAAHDLKRTGSVSFGDFFAGLRANGAILTESDAMLAAVEIDPEGGGSSVAYHKVAELLSIPQTNCPLPS